MGYASLVKSLGDFCAFATFLRGFYEFCGFHDFPTSQSVGVFLSTILSALRLRLHYTVFIIKRYGNVFV